MALSADKTNEKQYDEMESLRLFHDGPLERCPECGRMIFQPCLACMTERMGKVVDPWDDPGCPEEILRIQLNDYDRQRYEEFHLDKAIRQSGSF